MPRSQTTFRRLLLLAPLAAPLAWSAANGYLQHNLVADQPGIADFVDPNLVNPWGISTSSSSPFWVSDGGTGLASVYTSNGTPNASTHPAIVGSAKLTGPALVTGQVSNATGGFLVQGKGASFLFVTADGTISGWASTIDATKSQLVVDNSATGAAYYGMAISSHTSGAANPQIYVANIHSGAIEVYDTNYKPVTLAAGSFVDPAVPAGYGPFNVWDLNGKLYVTWAKQSPSGAAWVNGAGLGAVSVFDFTGKLLQSLAVGGTLNAPWGVAIAPATFGAFANDILIGNFGDGAINAFDPTTGKFEGQLQDQNGNVISIPGLWALIVGNNGSGGDPNAVYFSAGYASQKHGVIGSLQAAPTITANGIGNAADTANGIAPSSYVSIFGASLAAVTRSWAVTDFVSNKLPTSLSGVSVTVNGKPAWVFYVSPKQIDVLTPVDTTVGPIPVVVTNNGLVSASVTATLQTYSPAFFLYKDGKSISATHGVGGALVGATTLYPGASSPALPGEIISLFGTGFGQTTPAISDGAILAAPAPLAGTPTISFGGANAQVIYSGLVQAGVYQFDVVVPATAAAGDVPVTISIGGVTSAAGTTINVQ